MLRLCCIASWLAATRLVMADPIGLVPLLLEQPSLDGAGVRLVQAEGGGVAFQVNPTQAAQPPGLFRWISVDGSSTEYPNDVGEESDHANEVGNLLFGASAGIAPGVAHVDNYEATYWYESVIVPRWAISAEVVNQSFVFVLPQPLVDRAYDDYAATYNVLFVSGAGNGGAIMPPATSYNGIAVAALGGASSVGPTTDNGRSKPDLTAPASFTSHAAPLVSGAAALLWQAGRRGDGGSPLEATNALCLKALLLNGAVKPADWTNGPTRPLDARHGAGVLNVYQSYLHLVGGQHDPVETTTPPTGGDHPPGTASGRVQVLRGWDLHSLTSTLLTDGVNHYYFELPAQSAATFSISATLVWARHFAEAGVNDLDLFLYDAGTGALVASSRSAVDNVEHVFLNGLVPGRYDLQVRKPGGLGNGVSLGETYALAFEFAPEQVRIVSSGPNLSLVWPVSAAGFALQSTPALGSPWQTVAPGTVSNGFHWVDEAQPGFYRLAR